MLGLSSEESLSVVEELSQNAIRWLSVRIDNINPYVNLRRRKVFLDCSWKEGLFNFVSCQERLESQPGLVPDLEHLANEFCEKQNFPLVLCTETPWSLYWLIHSFTESFFGAVLKQDHQLTQEIKSQLSTELTRTEPLWRGAYWCRGIHVHEPLCLVVAEVQISLRAPTEEELIEGFNADDMSFWFTAPTCVIEITAKGSSNECVMSPLLWIENTLQLFTNHAIERSEFAEVPHPFVLRGPKGRMNARPGVSTSCLITADDFAGYKVFAEAIIEFGLTLGLTEAGKRNQPFLIALANYVESFRMVTSRAEFKFTSAVMSLESLLTNNEPGISFSLATRGAIIANLCGLDALNVRNALKTAYDIRSALVHGSLTDLKDWAKIIKKHGQPQELDRLVHDIARRALILLLCAELDGNLIPKDDLLKLLDDSLLSSDACDFLKNVTERGLLLPLWLGDPVAIRA